MTVALRTPAQEVDRPWTLDAAEVAVTLGTDPGSGLSAGEVTTRLARFGPNELLERKGKPPLLLFLEQFANTMLVVLMIAAAVTAAIGDVKDTIVIMAIVVLSGIVGFVQEYRSEQAMAALEEMTSPTARVMREGAVVTVAASEVVPGDLVLLEAGDIVAVDLRLIKSHSLRVNEAALTGESEPAAKIDTPLPEVADSLLADQRNMAFKGTTVTYGRATGVTVATGMATELGRIAELLQEHPAGQTPLQRRLSTLGKRLAAAALVVCAVVFAAGVARGESVELMFLTAVSLAVAAIPEALPAVVTVSLALGAQRMARRRALVRKLPAVETLGSVTVVCSDKTGTLTQNRMMVERVWTPAGEYLVTGAGYEPAGTVEGRCDPGDDPYLVRAAHVAAACNDARLHAPGHPGDAWTIDGDPTEGALLAFAGKLGVLPGELEERSPRVAEIAFDATRRRMLTLHRDGPGTWAAAKGALEALTQLAAPTERSLWRRPRRPQSGTRRRGTACSRSPSGGSKPLPAISRRRNPASRCSRS